MGDSACCVLPTSAETPSCPACSGTEAGARSCGPQLASANSDTEHSMRETFRLKNFKVTPDWMVMRDRHPREPTAFSLSLEVVGKDQGLLRNSRPSSIRVARECKLPRGAVL